ncbi:MAG: hypothetical protein LBK26_04675 [Rickettsiales bacterium]|jgi:hypothetical protein|nr:hypothetical protein [Rickettsiales bacterium]MDR1338348.1 hypothetical protein [Rickettsiales bacterium]
MKIQNIHIQDMTIKEWLKENWDIGNPRPKELADAEKQLIDFFVAMVKGIKIG